MTRNEKNGAARKAARRTPDPYGAGTLLPADVSRANILIVDDRPDKRLALEAILEDLGQNIVGASSGEEALRQVLEQDFAVILLDVNMPGLDGLETAALIRSRKRSAHVPIIFITADFQDEIHTAKGYSLGAVDYIGSPVVPEILRAKVKVFVDLYLLAQQAKRRAEEHIALVEEKAARAAAEQASRRLAFVADASAKLGGSLDVDETIRALASALVPAVCDVALVCIDYEEGEERHCKLGAEGSAGVVEVADVPCIEDDALQQLIDEGHRAGHPVRHPAAGRPRASSLRFPGPRLSDAALAVPLDAGGRHLGVVVLAMTSSMRSFDADTTAIAGDLSARAATALDNALLYRRIQESDQRKNEFLAMLAHELRNPMAPIGNAVHVLQADAGPTELAWARDVIDRQLKQLTRLVDDLLDLSRITRGKIQLKTETIDVGKVVAAAVETSRPLIDQNRHRLTVLVPPQPLHVRADFARLAQVVANLLNNAAKYTDVGGRITLTVAEEGSEVVFRVRDSGMGIPREFLRSIFEPFTQVDRTLDRSQGGLGIGLTLVHRLVTMFGGSVHATSDGLNRGSEFTVRLPLVEAAGGTAGASATAAPEPARSSGGKGLSVLVVDDNKDVAESTALVLRMTGCSVHLAHDGRAAIEAAERIAPDVVLLDIGLPGMNGYEVAERIRSMPDHRRTLIVAVSGYGQAEYQARSKSAGFDHHLVKPIDLPVLMNLLSTVPRAATTDNVVPLAARRS